MVIQINKELRKKGIDIVFFILAIVISVITVSYQTRIAKIGLGILIVCGTILILRKYLFDRQFSIMFAVILYINFSLLISECIMDGKLTLPVKTLQWQVYRNTEYEYIFLTSLLLFVSTFNLILPFIKVQYNNANIQNKDNVIVFSICFFVLIFALFNGYTGGIGASYQSNTTTLYEYAILFYVITWYYAGKSTIRNRMLQLYAGIYIAQAIIHGDRSSAFPMILLIVLIYFNNISLFKLLLYAIIGIMFANAISVYRLNYTLNNFFERYLSSYGLFNFASDTVSQSYYTGISLVAFRELVEEAYTYLRDFVVGIFVGGKYGKADLPIISQKYLTNKGGGMFISNFVFWFGIWGAFIAAVIVGCFLNVISNTKYEIGKVWKLYFVAMVFRWYLYTPFVFCRGVCFVFPIVYIFFAFIDTMSRREKKFKFVKRAKNG